jgi:Bacterial Ig-like domain/WD40-like Beta Propeller Repeat
LLGLGRRPLVGLPLLALLVLPLLQVSCDSPPQILEISPGRGARDVPTNAPVRIRFDRALDRASLASRFSLRPKVSGQISWEASNTLVFQHDTLDVNTQYTVVLNSGYRDAAGNVNAFNHSWSFQTELPPEPRGTTPGQGDSQVDPSTYLGLSFSREMAADSFRGAVTFLPSISFAVRSDPVDAKRVLIAPKSLLAPLTTYDVSISADATDADGNHLHPLKLHFTTGNVHSLSRWITFVASESGAAAGSGVWMVDEAGFPRSLEETAADAFSWSPDGANLLIRHPDLTWTDYPLGADPISMPFSAEWAAYLGPDAGYAYLTGSHLVRLLGSGAMVPIADGVTQAAVSRDLSRIVFSQGSSAGTDIRAYDIHLRAQYRIQHEPDLVTSLAWSPDGTRIAYLVSTSGSAGQGMLRVKALAGSAAVTTIATGEIATPAWLANSSDITFSARLAIAGKSVWRIFRVNPALAPGQLTAAASIGRLGDVDAFLPQPSPDGHQIAFLVGAPESAQIWLMNVDGTGQSRLTGFDLAAFPYSCRALHWAIS